MYEARVYIECIRCVCLFCACAVCVFIVPTATTPIGNNNNAPAVGSSLYAVPSLGAGEVGLVLRVMGYRGQGIYGGSAKVWKGCSTSTWRRGSHFINKPH